MTVHKLSAGDGYTYLTRQVASADERRRRGQSLTDYYLDQGNPPGTWVGKGAAQLGVAGSEVTESQMRALFGQGLHPDGVTKLGAAYPNYADLAPYADRVAARIEDFTHENGRPPSEFARSRIAAMEARRGRRAVAGYDLVFTPVKSASLLWALGGPEMQAADEDAHHEAVTNVVGWLEEHAAYTRVGRGGHAQIDTIGLVCVAFDHRESRAGDPDLHTHLAIANKVCGVDGKWRSLDARVLYALGVAASERYNTRFEDALARRASVTFVERADGRSTKRAVREIDGVSSELIRHFSRRRAAIEDRYAELRAEYRSDHGREPDQSAQIRLAQQATLETRESKGEARSLAEQISDWRRQAVQVVGNRRFARFVRECTGKGEQVRRPSTAEIAELAAQVVRHVSEQRSTWTIWNVLAEAERTLRPIRTGSAQDREALTRSVVERATSPECSIRIRQPELITEPEALTRASDGESVFVAHGSDRYTTATVLLAEEALIDAARGGGGPSVERLVLDARLAGIEARAGVRLDQGQRRLVDTFATSTARLVVGIGPAGAGKTTAMSAFATAWAAGGGRVVPVATSSRAAQILGEELCLRAENLHKFLHENARGVEQVDPWFQLRAGDVVLVDEAGMAGTLQLASLLNLATQAGAAVRLLGDPAQLAAVDAGGALKLLEAEVGATHLTDLHRFSDPAEGAATLRIRSGDRKALEFYADNDRIRSGARDAMLEAAYDAWALDVSSGQRSVLVAATTADVSALNARARVERVLAGQVDADGVELHDGNLSARGDWIVTRTNARTLGYRKSRWVHNGDTWHVLKAHRDGSLTVRNIENRGRIRLPADYVADSVELSYACTAHRAQGSTTDTAHALVTPEMTREALYVASSRGRDCTTWYVATDAGIAVDCDHEPGAPQTADEILTTVLRRTGAEDSATLAIRSVADEATALPTLIARYEHARVLASTDALRSALKSLPASAHDAILSDRAAPHLARALSTGAARGADPGRLLRAAYDYQDMDGVHSAAATLASRLVDMPRSLGVPNQTRADRPLPWLPAARVGHPAWDEYLGERARLITDRVGELGSLAAAYREQYAIAANDLDDLGPIPIPGGQQAVAHAAALESLAVTPPRPTAAPAVQSVPERRPSGSRRSVRQLTR
ncbi:MAG: MobF family relaxase [Marmoricola sp.]